MEAAAAFFSAGLADEVEAAGLADDDEAAAATFAVAALGAGAGVFEEPAAAGADAGFFFSSFLAAENRQCFQHT